MGSELFISIVCDESWPTDELLAATNLVKRELEQRTGRSIDSGGGRGSRDFWLPTFHPEVDRRLVAEIMGRIAPEAIYTVETLWRK